MARRVTISNRKRAKAARKASSRASRQFAPKQREARRSYRADRRLDVKIPRRQSERSFQRERQSYKSAGRYAKGGLDQALAGVGKLGLGRYERDVRDEFRGMRADVPAGVHAGVTAARQTRNDELADIAMTARALRSNYAAERRGLRTDEAEAEHDIRRDITKRYKGQKQKRLEQKRKQAKKQKERAHDKRTEAHKTERQFDRKVKDALAEIRSQIDTQTLSGLKGNKGKAPAEWKVKELSAQAKRAGAKQAKRELRRDPNKQKQIVQYLQTKQDTDRRAAQAAVGRFMQGPKARKMAKRSGGSAQKAARIHERQVKRDRRKSSRKRRRAVRSLEEFLGV